MASLLKSSGRLTPKLLRSTLQPLITVNPTSRPPNPYSHLISNPPINHNPFTQSQLLPENSLLTNLLRPTFYLTQHSSFIEASFDHPYKHNLHANQNSWKTSTFSQSISINNSRSFVKVTSLLRPSVYSTQPSTFAQVWDQQCKRSLYTDQNPQSPNFLKQHSTSAQQPQGENDGTKFKHQEIEGPTVERDMSALAEETRQVLESQRKTMYDLSKVLAILSLVQLSCGAWVAYVTRSSPLTEVSMQSFVAFAFPFTMAFLLRKAAKPMSFWMTMEERGRLQILTMALQTSKCLNLFFSRTRVVSLTCIVGMLIGLIYHTWSSSV